VSAEPAHVSRDNRRQASQTLPGLGFSTRTARIRVLLERDAYRIDLDQLAERIVDDETRRR
jgi:hypothetical protein